MTTLRTLLLATLATLAWLPSAQAEGDDVEPEITIRSQQNESIIEEYRVNGNLYMIKVTPKKGPSYFLVDSNGDGELDQRKSDLDPHMLIPRWVLFSW
ncbi:MAG: DUF2782 domain-containing protein [Gammaproteobacteria bacterium]|nr:DUF2782 domain-containing protein [Gammaproteobacteria bacterium]